MTKNKSLAAWLAFLGGPLGLHRFYLHGLGDLLGWLLPIPTALGLYGVQRIQQFGRWSPLELGADPAAGFHHRRLRAHRHRLRPDGPKNGTPASIPHARPTRRGSNQLAHHGRAGLRVAVWDHRF